MVTYNTRLFFCFLILIIPFRLWEGFSFPYFFFLTLLFLMSSSGRSASGSRWGWRWGWWWCPWSSWFFFLASLTAFFTGHRGSCSWTLHFTSTSFFSFFILTVGFFWGWPGKSKKINKLKGRGGGGGELSLAISPHCKYRCHTYMVVCQRLKPCEQWELYIASHDTMIPWSTLSPF